MFEPNACAVTDSGQSIVAVAAHSNDQIEIADERHRFVERLELFRAVDNLQSVGRHRRNFVCAVDLQAIKLDTGA